MSENNYSVISFFHLMFVCYVALFPPINPIGTALIIAPSFTGHSLKVRRLAALKIALYCLGICLFFGWFGGYFFKLFGISTSVIQITGGMLITKMGLNILGENDKENKEKIIEKSIEERVSNLNSHLFYPLAFPTTTGGGTIAVLLALSANSYSPNTTIHLLNMGATTLACVLMSLSIYLCYVSAPIILNKLSNQTLNVCNKLSGFLTLCVGVQIFVNGVIGVLSANNISVNL